ncbi:MAG: efflux RND transporter permease subunit, partial [Polyangia bacterium]
MNLSSIAIRRPVFTVMMTVALLVLGFLGMRRLGTDLFPDVTFPVVTVMMTVAL